MLVWEPVCVWRCRTPEVSARCLLLLLFHLIFRDKVSSLNTELTNWFDSWPISTSNLVGWVLRVQVEPSP